ncbi:MAG: hypothetical protein LBR68_01035 [Lachnoclostridium sp.]|jgi:hypothetical protein|nr:hypothetical protein [Lachnoclostridium sp.]
MARTCKYIEEEVDFEAINSHIVRFMTNEGFLLKNYKGRQIWKKGAGPVGIKKYIMIEHETKGVSLYAWIKVGLGIVGDSEKALTGNFAVSEKQKLLTQLEQLESIIIRSL